MTSPDIQQQMDWMAELGPILTSIDAPEADLLLPPLRAALIEMDMGIAIKHPWVNQCMGIMVGQANKQLIGKIGMTRDYLGEKPVPNWEAYLHVVVERPWRMPTLEQLWVNGRLDKEQLRDLLPGIWTDTEMPSTNLARPVYLWEVAEFATDDQDEWDDLPDSFPIYRGGPAYGISWTREKAQAKWFATRLGQDFPVWETTINKSQALGYLTGRGESEIILPPEAFDWRL